MPFEKFVVVNGTEHKVQCAKLNAQRLQGLVSFEKFVVQSITIRSRYLNLFYFLVLQNVENRVKNSWSQNHRKSFSIRQLKTCGLEGAYEGFKRASARGLKGVFCELKGR